MSASDTHLAQSERNAGLGAHYGLALHHVALPMRDVVRPAGPASRTILRAHIETLLAVCSLASVTVCLAQVLQT